jgi:hypothetical protein
MPRSPTPLESLLEKLLLAGWVIRTGTLDRKDRSRIRAIEWTDEGVKTCATIGVLVDMIEDNTGQLSPAEILAFVTLVKDQSRSIE